MSAPVGASACEGRELVGHLALVALAVGVEVRVVDARGALDEDHRRVRHAAAGRVGEEQRDVRVARGVVGLLRVADAGRDVDAALAGAEVGRDGPHDGAAVRVDGHELAREVALGGLLELGGKGRRHAANLAETELGQPLVEEGELARGGHPIRGEGRLHREAVHERDERRPPPSGRRGPSRQALRPQRGGDRAAPRRVGAALVAREVRAADGESEEREPDPRLRPALGVDGEGGDEQRPGAAARVRCRRSRGRGRGRRRCGRPGAGGRPCRRSSATRRWSTSPSRRRRGARWRPRGRRGTRSATPRRRPRRGVLRGRRSVASRVLSYFITNVVKR